MTHDPTNRKRLSRARQRATGENMVALRWVEEHPRVLFADHGPEHDVRFLLGATERALRAGERAVQRVPIDATAPGVDLSRPRGEGQDEEPSTPTDEP